MASPLSADCRLLIGRGRRCHGSPFTSDWPGPRVSTRIRREVMGAKYWKFDAVFTTAKQQRPGVNQAECLACHKPLDKTSYTFTIEQLAAVAKTR